MKTKTDKFRCYCKFILTSRTGESVLIEGGNDKLREARVLISSMAKAYRLIVVE